MTFINCLYTIFPFLRSNPAPAPLHPQLAPLHQPNQIVIQNIQTPPTVNRPILNPQPSNSEEKSIWENMSALWKSDERVPVYNYTRKEKQEIKQIIGGYVDEINIANIILDHLIRWNSCEYCTYGLKKDWIRLPCDHYIHKGCFNKINKHCPNCHETMFNNCS